MERAIETLVKDYKLNTEDAKAYVQEVFSLIDSETTKNGYKPFSEEQKANIAIAGAKVLREFGEKIVNDLKQ